MDKRYFIGHNGMSMIYNVPFDFSVNFDWVVTSNTIHKIKNTEHPRSIYVKTDYLPFFNQHVLTLIQKEFILVSACSDYSPYVNFRSQYFEILSNPHLKYWWSENTLGSDARCKSLPVGVASSKLDYDLKLKTIADDKSLFSNQRVENKILCIWRDRTFQVCGPEYHVRPHCSEYVVNHQDIFETKYLNQEIDQDTFLKLMQSYKYVFCPIGNGVDPNPKLLESLCCKCIPILINNPNTQSMHDQIKFPCILVDKVEDIVEKNVIDQCKLDMSIGYDECIQKFSAKLWADYIHSHIEERT
jgi:hypothetical protein